MLFLCLALCAALLRVLAYRRQMNEMARMLEETPPDSNVCLTVCMSGAPARRLCRAMHARLESARELRRTALRSEREIKYTMACISHDIRTPLAGAMGYLQLLKEEPERRTEYLPIVTKRLQELEELLDSLFLYTRLQNGAAAPVCESTAALLPLWDVLAALYPRLRAAHIEPQLQADREDIQVWANPDALRRIYQNLVLNAIRHGGGGLTITVREQEILFSNPLAPGETPDAAHLFDRFYQAAPARTRGGAGLGLSIVRELMEQMGGSVSARADKGELCITLRFCPEHKGESTLPPA